jgi:SWIM zinc finger
VVSKGAPYRGAQAEEIKVWGRRRLLSLARVLPLAERIEVRLLGSGLPSIWVVHMGEMRFTLALSGWTTNDWSAGASLELLAPSVEVGDAAVARLRRYLMEAQRAPLERVAAETGLSREIALAGLYRLAKEGQVIYDFTGDLYRWREVMPWALSLEKVGAPPPEVVEGQKLASRVRIERRELVGAKLLVVAKVENTSVEALFTPDRRMGRARCSCSYFHKNRMRTGPCRHLLALQLGMTALQ